MAKATTLGVTKTTPSIDLTNTSTNSDTKLLDVKTKILFNLVNLKEYLNFSVLERRIDLPNGTLIRFLEGKSNKVKPIHLHLLKSEVIKIETLLTELKANTATFEQLEMFL
jgi:hypothetical protein